MSIRHLLVVSAALLFLPAGQVMAADTLIQNKGSDTLVNVAQAWAEEYKGVDTGVAVAVSGGGSGTGIAAMINGTVDIANASRKMKKKELDKAREQGQNPVEHVVGYDALAVFLHQDNPTDSLSFTQIAQIYGRGGDFESWSDLGVSVPGCGSDEIVVVSRQNNSGTYSYFRSAVLKSAAKAGVIDKGSFRQGTLDMHGSKDVVDLVEKTPCAIGYSGLAYATDHIKLACVSPVRRRGLRQTDRRHGQRSQLSDSPPVIHVYERRTGGCDQDLPRLDQVRHGPVYSQKQGVCAGARDQLPLGC